MQSMEFNRSNLLLALRGYSSAVSHMEQTVLLPSLLRDVPGEEDREEPCRDLYGDYLMLKSVRNAVESGLAHLEDKSTSKVLASVAQPELEPESLLRFHLSGLFAVVSQLTCRSHRLTQKYLDIVGISN
ncbi:mid1-interacting protein 1-B-like [Syngnathoides biaculeatus]|uniref:mid1-interacting protein 1-B-like n=1 Tax=Syngnathoides biaculeatus TaxID=300417 RepID=UPI002ADD7410|nr:mid1-interacting protein 1-B-like [Syngnathoides biaculeatus]